MAFTKKPLKWTALGQEPSELKKSEGFKMDESPAPGHFDFMFRSTYEAIEELQQKAGEVKTVNNVQPDVNGNVLIPLPDTSKLYQKPTTGIPTADLDTSVQASLKKADDAAPLTELAKTNQALTTHQAEYEQHIGDLVSHGVYGAATGTNTLAMTISNVTAYVEGMLVAFKNTTANTGAVTLNINSLGAKAIKKANGNALTSGNLKAGGIYQLRYDGSSFILLGEGGEYGTATASDVLAGKTFGTENGIVQGTLTFSKIQAGDTNKLINFTSQRVLGWPYSTYTTYKKLQMKYTGSIRLNIKISTYNSMNSTCGYKLLKNGVSIKQTEQKNNISETFDFSISKLDIIELQLYSTERDKIVINTEIFSCDVIYNDGIIVDLTTLISEVA